MRHPKAVGDQTTLAAMLALQDVGFIVSVPFGENARYDLVIDDEIRLARVQCKTGRLREGAVVFKVCSSYAHHSNPASAARDYLGQVEYFAVYCPGTSGVYPDRRCSFALGGTTARCVKPQRTRASRSACC